MLTKEQIIEVLQENISIEQTGYMNSISELVGLEDAAEEILSLLNNKP
jgi:hypothetical protein